MCSRFLRFGSATAMMPAMAVTTAAMMTPSFGVDMVLT